MHTQRVVSARHDPLGAAAAQDVDDVSCAESLATLREARNAGQKLLRLNRAVAFRPRLAAIVASAAGALERLVEVAQLNGATAFGRFGVAQDLAQLLARDALLALERITGVGIDLLLDEEFGGANVREAEI